MSQKVGFISFRFAGIDGVTLETLKWVEIFKRNKWECFFCCGESSFSSTHSLIDEQIHFNHPKIQSITKRCFNTHVRSPHLTTELHNTKEQLKKVLYKFINTYNINLLVIQNVLAIPMNIPLSMALVEVLAETNIPTIAHHHDFYWERVRYGVNCIQDILSGCFPPNLSNVVHVTINSLADAQLGYRTGVSSTIIPNVMDFATHPKGADDFNKDLREHFTIEEDELLILQPTRIVQRKGIEHAIELTHRINKRGKKAKLVISHSSGDEGNEYQNRVLEFATMLGVQVILGDGLIEVTRNKTKDGKKIYTLEDIYIHADIVTYPSLIEGFGNAFLEAIYFHAPIIINRYPVYNMDIRPKGFQCIEFDNFISSKTIDEVLDIMLDKKRIKSMTNINYNLALQHYSLDLLNNKIKDILTFFYGV